MKPSLAVALKNLNYPIKVVGAAEQAEESGKISNITDKKVRLLKNISVGLSIGVKFDPMVWLETILPMTMELIDKNKAENARIWFDRCDSYYHLGFDIGDAHYEVRFYRTFELSKNFDNDLTAVKTMRDSKELLKFFKDGVHDRWYITFPALTNMNAANVMIKERENQIRAVYPGYAGICVPIIWQDRESFYLGTDKITKQVRWRIALMHDAESWEASVFGSKKRLRARHFLSILQFSLQIWNWLSEE